VVNKSGHLPPVSVLERMVSVRIHLDDCSDSNGALRVLPGTHNLGRVAPTQIAKQERPTGFLRRARRGHRNDEAIVTTQFTGSRKGKSSPRDSYRFCFIAAGRRLGVARRLSRHAALKSGLGREISSKIKAVVPPAG